MILKKHKFKLRKEIDFFIKAKRYFGDIFTIFYIFSHNQTLVSVVVPKKVANKATLRVKIKRLVSAQLNKNITKLKDIKLVLVVKKELIDKIKKQDNTSEIIDLEIVKAFDKINKTNA